MSDITYHKGSPIGDAWDIELVGNTDSLGAYTHYVCTGLGTQIDLVFHTGKMDGLSEEVVLAVLIDRLNGLQSGKTACEEYAEALHHLKLAFNSLQTVNKRFQNPLPEPIKFEISEPSKIKGVFLTESAEAELVKGVLLSEAPKAELVNAESSLPESLKSESSLPPDQATV